MKRKIVRWLSIVMTLTLWLPACQRTNAPVLQEGASLSKTVESINGAFGVHGVSMAVKVDERALWEVFHVPPEQVLDYAGLYSASINSADNLLVVEAKAGQMDMVRSALERRRDEVAQNFAGYLPEQYHKVKTGKVLVLGDYVALIVIGDESVSLSEEIGRAEEMLRQMIR